MPIRALLMDIDDTLFDFQTSSRNALSIAFRALNLPFTPEMWAHYRELDAEFWQRFERGEITKEALYVERFRVFFAEYGLEADPAAFNAAYFRELGDQCNFMPHCEQALRQLHAQYKIFIVTNGNTEIQTRRIAASGMAQYFDRVFISEQMGCKKPDKLFYDKVFAEIGEAYRTVAHDNPLTDEKQQETGRTLLGLKQTDMFEAIVSAAPDGNDKVSRLIDAYLTAFQRRIAAEDAGGPSPQAPVPDFA